MDNFSASWILPRHYKTAYPKLIKLFDSISDFNFRDNISPEELTSLKIEKTETITDIDKFLESGQSKYMGFDDTDTIFNSLLARVTERTPDRLIQDMERDFTLQRVGYEFNTADGFVFEAAPDEIEMDGRVFISGNNNQDNISEWFNTLGFPYISHDNISDDEVGYLITIDEIRLLKILKYIHAIKGTTKSIQLFFSIWFGEEVLISYPKFKMAIIDGDVNGSGMVPDGGTVMRDDEKYQEYSIVIETDRDPLQYDSIMNKVFKPLFQPSGFRVELKQKE